MDRILLPYYWKYVGGILLIAGIILGMIYLTNDFSIRMPVFAILSSFIETRMFVTFSTNIADDLILLLLISGSGLIVLSKERNESAAMTTLRARAFIQAFVVNWILLILSVLFIFGGAFMGALILNLISFSILYIVFLYFLRKNCKS